MPASQPSNKKTKAIADGVSGIGTHRYGLYRAAWQRVNQATEAGYHLEAIALLESLLSDRMESRASYLTGKNHGYSMLGDLVRLFETHERVEDFSALVERIDSWRRRRNRALHEMVKFAQGEFPTWEQQTADLPEIVRDGQTCLHDFAALDERERMQAGVSPPATWPNAFGHPTFAERPGHGTSAGAETTPPTQLR
jgi:hypothetical protein